jgi:NAD(P)-dependent dehydrogenase (short-subunit alcohol dehydrogenase family)
VADLMSKAAITYAAKHLAAQNVKDHGGQTVVCIAPGATMTDMFRTSTLSVHPEPLRLIASFPKKRLIDPTEIAQLCYFVATSPAGRVLHGSVIDASLGLGVRSGLQTELEWR